MKFFFITLFGQIFFPKNFLDQKSFRIKDILGSKMFGRDFLDLIFFGLKTFGHILLLTTTTKTTTTTTTLIGFDTIEINLILLQKLKILL